MQNFYIFKYDYKESSKNVSSTVIFCDNTKINKDNLIDEIGGFYESYSQTDKVFIIGGKYLKKDLLKIFRNEREETFKKIPKRNETSLFDNIHILTFDKIGVLEDIDGNSIPSNFLKGYLNEGLQRIFISRGGLVETEGSHHYVFPSGKHCDKFLRTGNILLFSSEIYFIAFSLLKYLDENLHDQIYCDSSSINSIALALTSLKNRFVTNNKVQAPIESFSSYKGLYENELNYKRNALILISASTSGNIIDYISENHNEVKRSNIVILYYLDLKDNYSKIKDRVLCNLTYEEIENRNGIKAYKSYKEENCVFCENGSYPVEVKGDVFLLEKPKINSVLISIYDAQKKLSSFVDQFKSSKSKDTVLKSNYKENSEPLNKYDIYIDYSEILDGIKNKNNRFKKYNKKLNAYIDQFIPSQTKFIIHLNDESSKELANYIYNRIGVNFKEGSLPSIVSQDDFSEKLKEETEGSVLVVGSCISNGKNLLYLSRALRNFRKLRVVYFIGITRMSNSLAHKTLKSNLKQGNYGSETSTYIEVENIYCSNISKNNPWQQEISFLKQMISILKDSNKDEEVINFFVERKNLINQSYSTDQKGLSKNLFFNSMLDFDKELKIRNNFAFFNFDSYVDEVTQSDIYFTFNNVINSIRNSDGTKNSLEQTSFVRNLLSPNNFNRFNDGIIQASILRSALSTELSYSIDFGISREMKGILETLIKYHNDSQGEALLEFLFAICIRKLSLKKEHLEEIISLLKEIGGNEVLKCFTLYMENEILQKDKEFSN